MSHKQSLDLLGDTTEKVDTMSSLSSLLLDSRARDLGLSEDEFNAIVGICWKFVNTKDSLDDLLQIALLGVSSALSEYEYYTSLDKALCGKRKSILSRRSFLNRVVTYTLINEVKTTSCDMMYTAVPYGHRKMVVSQAAFAYGAPESTSGLRDGDGTSLTSSYYPSDDFRRVDDLDYVRSIVSSLPRDELELVYSVLNSETIAGYARRKGVNSSSIYPLWHRIRATLASGILNSF